MQLGYVGYHPLHLVISVKIKTHIRKLREREGEVKEEEIKNESEEKRREN